MSRLRTLLILLLFALMIYAVLRFEAQRREDQMRSKAAQTKVPEFFLEQSLTTHYAGNGKVEYQLNSDRLEYFAQEDHAELTKAYFIFYNQQGLSWHSRSDTAILKSKNQEIEMKGNVRIWQPDRQMEITTDSLFLSDSRSIAETNDLIEVKSPSGQLKCVGMKLDMNAEKLQFISQVSGQYLPVIRPAKKPAVKRSGKLKRKPGKSG